MLRVLGFERTTSNVDQGPPDVRKSVMLHEAHALMKVSPPKQATWQYHAISYHAYEHACYCSLPLAWMPLGTPWAPCSLQISACADEFSIFHTFWSGTMATERIASDASLTGAAQQDKLPRCAHDHCAVLALYLIVASRPAVSI